MTKLVWRVQSTDGRGLYVGRPLNCTDEMNYDPNDKDKDEFARMRHPCPADDYELAPQWESLRRNGIHDMYIFGFLNPEQLLSWVYKEEWHEEIHNAGFKVYVFEVPDEYVCTGATQACFYGYHATLISVVDIIDLA